MLKPQDKGVAHLTHPLHRALPLEPLTRSVNLAAVAVGSLRSKSRQKWGSLSRRAPGQGAETVASSAGRAFSRTPASVAQSPLSPGPNAG